MIRLLILMVLTLWFISDAIAQDTNNKSRTDALTGTWKIDLRPSPESPAYLQEFVIQKIEGRTFSGTFYGSDVRDTQINFNWDRLYFAFTTSDNTHEYYHTGYYFDGQLIGTSYCPGRDLLQPWVGKRT